MADTLEGVQGIVPELFGDGAFRVFKEIDTVLILACGTSYYSGCIAKYWLEGIAKIPTQDVALVESQWGLSENNRRAKFYQLTPEGRRNSSDRTVHWTRYADAVFKILRAAEERGRATA